MNKIKILLVEDDIDWLQMISEFLNHEKDFQVTGKATSHYEALQLVTNTEFDIVLLDINLTKNQLDGIYTAVEISESNPDAKIIMLTSLNDEEIIKKAFTAGAINYVAKPDFEQLPHVIRFAFSHSHPMEVFKLEFHRLKREEQLQKLTPAEKEVFQHIEKGMTQTEIGKKLYKSESTLKNQVNKILKKLGVKSSKEAVKKVKRKGL
ncbi:response regulator transcription factor [Chengkuizengella marina]|uniref:Response regulator transcription factor n=1 Tax=Chengkuizengella marina TaxID=2507566 RepID=A0A6N9PY17_9BACL|nr:response regulator transcription factor [Chengkuizengella marina]NBI27505.1 response regulator transcription factor [Chengkuizengella marina]